MADKRFNNAEVSKKWRKRFKENWDNYERRREAEEKLIKKCKEKQKYSNVVTIITKEVLRRENIQYTYVRLYPIIKEIIENSLYLSSRYSEEDIAPITSGVVTQCHYIVTSKDVDREEKE